VARRRNRRGLQKQSFGLADQDRDAARRVGAFAFAKSGGEAAAQTKDLLVKLAIWVTRKFKREPDLGLICALVCVFLIDIATITGGASQSAASWMVITCVPSALLVFLVFLSALERSRPRSARLIKRAAGGPETAPAAPARE
jgi:hypothetical protein